MSPLIAPDLDFENGFGEFEQSTISTLNQNFGHSSQRFDNSANSTMITAKVGNAKIKEIPKKPSDELEKIEDRIYRKIDSILSEKVQML